MTFNQQVSDDGSAEITMKQTSQNVFTRVTQEIIARLEKGTVPWHRPWKNGPDGSPLNLSSGKQYRGINVFLLGMQPYQSRYWLTFRQAVSLGGYVHKGEKSTPVFFWKWPDPSASSGQEKEKSVDDQDKPFVRHPPTGGGTDQAKSVPIGRCYHVFNVEQCEGVEYPKLETAPKPEWQPVEAAERIALGYQNAPQIEHRGDRAFYQPTTPT